MVKQVEVNGEQVILDESHALVASKSEPNYWHTIRPESGALVCDCKGYHHRQNCRHVRAVQAVIAAAEQKSKIQQPAPALPPRTAENAPLAGPAIDPPLFPPSKPWTRPTPKSFEELFGYNS